MSTITFNLHTVYFDKVKVRFAIEQAMKAQTGVQVDAYSSTLSLTSALVRGGWLTPRPGRFASAKENRHPLYRRVGGFQGRCGRVRKISHQPRFDPRTVQPLASRSTV